MENCDINQEISVQESTATVEKEASAIFCYNCGAEIKSEENFCSSCGANLIERDNDKKEKNKIDKKKRFMIIIGSSVVFTIAIVCVFVFCVMPSIAKEKIIGIWESDVFYSSKYGDNCILRLAVTDKGWVEIVIRTSDDKIAKLDYGKWNMDGMELLTLHETQEGVTGHYTYHLNDTLTSGLRTYSRVEE